MLSVHYRGTWRRTLSRWQEQLLDTGSRSSSSSTTKNAVTVVEVGPRDGLQNETATPLTVDQRVEFVKRLAKAGCRKIEVGSFVSPKWVPSMAHSDQVYERLVLMRSEEEKALMGDATLSCLVPNTRGMQDAMRFKVDEIAIFAAASDSFSQKVSWDLLGRCRFLSSGVFLCRASVPTADPVFLYFDSFRLTFYAKWCHVVL